MKKTLIALFTASIVLTALELIYVQSSPLLGEGNLEQMMDYSNGLGGYMNNSNVLYQSLYTGRVHERDPYASLYKLAATGPWAIDSMSLGSALWKVGLFNECEPGKINRSVQDRVRLWYGRSPAVATSQLIPLENYLTIDGIEVKSALGGKRGKAINSMALGWMELGDLAGGSNALFLFEDACGIQNNMSKRAFLEGMAEDYKVYLARTSFVDSVLDEEPAWKGILYMAYYPTYNKTWIVVQGIAEEDISKGKIVIDGYDAQMEVVYPFILVDGYVPEGYHTLTLSTTKTDYGLNFTIHPASPLHIEAVATGLDETGRFSLVLSNIDGEKTIHLSRIKGVLENEVKEESLDRNVSPYNATNIALDFGKNLKPGYYSDVSFTLSYDIEGRQEWFNRSVRLPAQ